MKIALVHHCNYGIECMTDKSYWFEAGHGSQEGDFVVTENKMANGKINLSIGWIEKIKDNEDENPTSKVIVWMRNYPKPILESEMGQEDDFDEEEILKYVKEYNDPEGVYGYDRLEDWAIFNDYILKDKLIDMINESELLEKEEIIHLLDRIE